MTSERPTYHGDVYVVNRPSYPNRVFDILEAYHRAGPGTFGHALDLGCGPGFMALGLTASFDKVTGIDPEQGMVNVGLQPQDPKKRIRYAVGLSEDLGAAGIEDKSVDLVVAGEAAHYFDHPKTWPELARVLRPGATVAYIDYGRISVPGAADVNTAISAFMDETLKDYWSEPGWSISESLLDMLPYPVQPSYTNATESLLGSLPDLEGDGHPIVARIPELPPLGSPEGWDVSSAVRLKSGTTAGQWFLKQEWTAAQLEGCFRTWSSVKRYQDHNAGDRELGPEKDVVGRVMHQIKPALGDRFVVAWPFAMMMIRRSA